jgi:hypothetical protein
MRVCLPFQASHVLFHEGLALVKVVEGETAFLGRLGACLAARAISDIVHRHARAGPHTHTAREYASMAARAHTHTDTPVRGGPAH